MKLPRLKSLICTAIVIGTLGAGALFGTGLAVSAEATQKTYTVQAGDTLDKIIRKFYPGSPLKIEALRSALSEQNRAAFTKGESKVLMAGALITLPDQMEIANALLSPKGEKSSEKGEYKGENGLGADNASMHRNWVRFP